MKYFVLSAACAAAFLTAPSALARSEANRLTTDFRDWQVACDNTRDCTALGFAAGDEAGGIGPHLFLTRAAGAAAAPMVEFGLGFGERSDGLGNGDVIDIVVEGPAPARFRAAIRKPTEDDLGALPLAVADIPRFVAALQAGTAVRLSHDGKEIGAVSLEGSSAALRWIDAQQRRDGGVTALVARGAKPASAIPGTTAPPLVRLGRRMSQAGVPTALPPALAGRADVALCAEEYDADDPHPPGVTRLSEQDYLWRIPCGSGAYNFSSTYIIAHRDGSAARSPNFSAEEPDQLVNSAYNAQTRLMEAFAKGRGVGDCGDEATWAWDGREFRLTHHALMETCMGVTSEHWPVVWRARIEPPLD